MAESDDAAYYQAHKDDPDEWEDDQVGAMDAMLKATLTPEEYEQFQESVRIWREETHAGKGIPVNEVRRRLRRPTKNEAVSEEMKRARRRLVLGWRVDDLMAWVEAAMHRLERPREEVGDRIIATALEACVQYVLWMRLWVVTLGICLLIAIGADVTLLLLLIRARL